MTLHFEQVWEAAEKTFSEEFPDKSSEDILNNLRVHSTFLEEFAPEEQKLWLGNLLYYVTGISKKLNINVYNALLETIQDRKIQFHGADDDS